jgi:hypothetical protein
VAKHHEVALPPELQVRLVRLTEADGGQEIHDLAKKMVFSSCIPYSSALPLAEEFLRSGFTLSQLHEFAERTGRSLVSAAGLMLEAKRLNFGGTGL